MKVIFLDVDGVLNYSSLFPAGRLKNVGETTKVRRNGILMEDGLYPLCSKACDRLILLVNMTGAYVVVSSTWRLDEDQMDKLRRSDVLFRCHEHWCTPPRDGFQKRGEEIQDWLDLHPEITEYVILDDAHDILETQKDRHVKTDFNIGLQDEHIDRAVDILCKK